MRFFLLFMLLSCSLSSISQNCNNTLSGSVIDLHDNSLLAGATLIVAGTEKAVLSDIDGTYKVPNLCNGTYSLQISHPFCKTRAFTVIVSGNTTKDFRLEHHLEELNQVLIEGNVFQDKTKTLKSNTLSNDELEQFSSGSLGDALNSISGVSSLNTGNTVVKPLINGLHSSRITIINNGVRMEDQEWGAEHAPNLDINSADEITLIKGAGALKYSGDAIGGVIITERKKAPLKDSIYGKTIVVGSTNGRGSSLTSSLTKSYENGWFGELQGTIKRFGDFEAPDYVLSNTGVFERNASFRVGLNRIDYGIEGYYSFYKNEIGILRASHLGGSQDQVSAINSDRPLIIRDFTYDIDAPKQDVTHNLARIKGFKKFEGFGRLNLQYDFQRNNRLEFDIRRGDDADKPSLDLELDTHSLTIDIDTDLSQNINLKAGVVGRFQTNFADPDTGVRRLIPDYDKYSLGAFGIATYQLNDKLLLEAGARFDYTYIDVFKFYRTSLFEDRGYDTQFPDIIVQELDNQVLTNPQLDFYNSSATVGLNYEFDDTYNIYFNYSLASRAPNPSELFSEGLHQSASRIEIGDLRFDSEIGHKFAATFQRQNQIFSFSVSPYINSISDFIVIEPVEIQQTIRGNFQVWEYRQTSAQLLGVDFDASLALTENLSYVNQFSFVKGYDTDRDEPLINIPAVSTKNELSYQNPNWSNLKLSLQSQYVFRQNEFPETNFEVFVPETQTNETVDVSTPTDAYHLLNFNSAIDVHDSNASTLTVGVSVNNVFDTSYRDYLNRFRYYADDLGRNFSLTLKLNY